MYAKYVDENTVEYLPRNMIIENQIVIESEDRNEQPQTIIEKKAISNISQYFDLNPQKAINLGYLNLVEEDQPNYDPNSQYLKEVFSISDNTIIKNWEIKTIEQIVE